MQARKIFYCVFVVVVNAIESRHQQTEQLMLVNAERAAFMIGTANTHCVRYVSNGHRQVGIVFGVQ